LRNQRKINVPKFKAEYGFYTDAQRSQTMKNIRGFNTKPEIIFRKALWHMGFRYRTNDKGLPGSPDIVLGKYKLVIFIDGEFWHGFNWVEKKKKIKANRGFWIPKIERNVQRDNENNESLINMGWVVFRFWQDEIRKDLPGCLNKVLNHIRQIDV